jgi:hypothetical protein
MRKRPWARPLLITGALAVLVAAGLVLALRETETRGGQHDAAPPRPGTPEMAGVRVSDVAREVGLDFRHGAFRFGVSGDPVPMMGGGLCWLDYDADGRLDLFVVTRTPSETPIAGSERAVSRGMRSSATKRAGSWT